MKKKGLLFVSIMMFTFLIGSVLAFNFEHTIYGLEAPEPDVITFMNNTGGVNASEFADKWITIEGTLNNVSDILHNWLSNLGWFDSGHFMDTDLDMGGNDIDTVNDIRVDNDVYISDVLEVDGDAWIDEQLNVTGDIYIGKRGAVQGNLIVFGGGNVSAHIGNFTGNVSGDWFNGKFNWTIGDDWAEFDGSIWTFNKSMLSTTFFNATTITVVTGTPQGIIANIQTYNGVSYNVSEDASDIEFIVNFTGVTDFNQLVIRYKSGEEIEPHRLMVQIYNIDSADWEDYGDLPESNTYSIVEFGVFDADEHIDGTGNVSVRFFQDEGVPPRTHLHNFDWVTIAKGFGIPSGEEVDPKSIHKDGSTFW